VAGLDPAELDSDYAARILIGTLALSMTMDSFVAPQRRFLRIALGVVSGSWT
jgi:hypothetical protein